MESVKDKASQTVAVLFSANSVSLSLTKLDAFSSNEGDTFSRNYHNFASRACDT